MASCTAALTIGQRPALPAARSASSVRRASPALAPATAFAPLRQLPAPRTSSRFVARATPTEEVDTTTGEVDVEAIVKDLQEKWDRVENKTSVAVYAFGAVTVLWLSSTIVNSVNSVPLLPKIFELVGLGYSAWFVYRYLLFKSSREELIADVEELKKKISGTQE